MQNSLGAGSISLCMIVKNEARRLQQCLESARPFVDQMIVVDTGSDDESRSIAQQSGAEVYEHPWEGHFSKARNQSLSYARGEWILILDGDEILDQESAQSLRRLPLKQSLEEGGIDAYAFRIVNFTTDQALEHEAGLQDQIRLFRNTGYYGYSGLIHNQLQNLKTQTPLIGEFALIKVFHYGYTPSVWQAQKKDERLVLLEQAVAEDPEHLFAYYNLANHLKILNRHEEALTYFIACLPEEGPLDLNWHALACFSGAFCANQIKNHSMAIHLCDRILDSRPFLIDAHLRKTEAYLSLKSFSKITKHIPSILRHPQAHAIKQKAFFFDLPYRLGLAHFRKHQFPDALHSFLALAPLSQDLTVFTHLSLCFIYLNHPWGAQWAYHIGQVLGPQDPDWPTVRTLYQKTFTPKTQDPSFAFSAPLELVGFPEVQVDHSPSSYLPGFAELFQSHSSFPLSSSMPIVLWASTKERSSTLSEWESFLDPKVHQHFHVDPIWSLFVSEATRDIDEDGSLPSCPMFDLFKSEDQYVWMSFEVRSDGGYGTLYRGSTCVKAFSQRFLLPPTFTPTPSHTPLFSSPSWVATFHFLLMDLISSTLTK